MNKLFEGINVEELFKPLCYIVDESTKRLRDSNKPILSVEYVEPDPEHPILKRWSYTHLHWRVKDISKRTYLADEKSFELVTEPNDSSFIKMLLVLSNLCSCDDTVVVYLQTRRYLNIDYRQVLYTINGKSKQRFTLKNIVGDPGKKYPYSRQYQSFREAISDDIQNLKLKLFETSEPVLCPISGIVLNMNNCHMDHWGLRFVQLVHRFLDNEKIIIDNVKCDSYVIEDKELRDKWIQFHKTNAKLRLLAAEENVRQECKRQGQNSPVFYKKAKPN